MFEDYDLSDIDTSLQYVISFMDLDCKEVPDNTYQRLLLFAIIMRRQLERGLEDNLSDAIICNLAKAKALVVWLCSRFETEPARLKEQILALKELSDKVIELFFIGNGESSVMIVETDDEELYNVITVTDKLIGSRQYP